MKLEDQVVSLDLAKRLKELGVRQESVFAWYDGKVVAHSEFHPNRLWGGAGLSAFTIAELGGILPKTVKEENRNPYELCINSYRNKWQVGYEIDGRYAWHIAKNHSLFETASTEADARAKLLIYLIENKLIVI